MKLKEHENYFFIGITSVLKRAEGVMFSFYDTFDSMPAFRTGVAANIVPTVKRIYLATAI